ncbi:MAG: ABC transporter ATP-binding protein [Alcaligenaceae bacterium]|nr:ABC transporter ATP-binding protein [Alcaligenaceae bacterium]
MVTSSIPANNAAPLLEIDNLSTFFDTLAGTVRSVNGVSYTVHAGETLGVVGESGCGKSVTALSVMRLVPTPPGRYASGQIRFRGTNLLDLSEKQMRAIRGNRISMIFQEPMTSLNPVLTIGRQIAETVMLHQKVGRREANKRVLEMLELVQIAEPARRINEYPYQLSGGMRQRVMIALALACNPDVLIADEPTTALDVTIQAQILDLLRSLQKKLGMGVIMITHDLGVVAECCDRVVVMYAGKKVEEAPVAALFEKPLHPYTRALMAAMPSVNTGVERLEEIPGLVPALHALGPGCSFAPRCGFVTARCHTEVPSLTACGDGHSVACFEMERVAAAGPMHVTAQAVTGAATPVAGKPGVVPRTPTPRPPVLEVQNLKKHYPGSRRWFGRDRPVIQAVDDISFSVAQGETLALVGESGCGKSTTGKTVLRLIHPTAGSIRLNGEDITALEGEPLRARRQDMQIIFQDPYASLNPRMTAGQIVAEPMLNFPGPETRTARQRQERVEWLFSKVGLRPESVKKYPHEFSGGQRQRLGIARALALQPKIIVCDEPVSALDVSVQAQVINLLTDLQKDMDLAYLFVAHDLAVVRHISHRVAVMYLGHIVEIADRDTLFSSPVHPYTEILLSAVPRAVPGAPVTRRLLEGDPPSPANPPSGCRFHTRCPLVQPVCRSIKPELTPRGEPVTGPNGEPVQQQVACHVR